MTPSEQARADALADAETLRRFVEDYAPCYRCTSGTDPRTYNVADASLDLDVASVRPHELLRDAAEIRESAHAAFRAIPGLRG